MLLNMARSNPKNENPNFTARGRSNPHARRKPNTREPMIKKKNSFFQHALRRIRKLKKRDFVDAETFTAGDKLCRVFASECFEKAQKLANNRPQPKEKMSLQYMKLARHLWSCWNGLAFTVLPCLLVALAS